MKSVFEDINYQRLQGKGGNNLNQTSEAKCDQSLASYWNYGILGLKGVAVSSGHVLSRSDVPDSAAPWTGARWDLLSGSFQARILEWVTVTCSGGSS